MKQEEKDLLLKDLCGRLPYGVKVRNIRNNFDISYFDNNVKEIKVLIEEYSIKPYLRPMSSMTKEEYEELRKIDKYYGIAPLSEIYDWEPGYKSIDWLLKHHFDFRGLIPMGLALEAPKDMYKF